MPKNADLGSILGFGYTTDAPTYNTTELNQGAKDVSESQMNRAKAGHKALAEAMARGVDQTGLAQGAAGGIANYATGLGGDQAKLMGNALSNRMSKRAANDLMGIQTNQQNQARLMNANDLSSAAAGRGMLSDIAHQQVNRAEEDYKNVGAAQNAGWGQLLKGGSTLAGGVLGALIGMPGAGGKIGNMAGSMGGQAVAKDDTADMMRKGMSKGMGGGGGMGGLLGSGMASMLA